MVSKYGTQHLADAGTHLPTPEGWKLKQSWKKRLHKHLNLNKADDQTGDLVARR